MNASQTVNKPQFRKLMSLDEKNQVYELQSVKDRIIIDIPIQLAIFILSLAKLRLLAFTYDEIDRLVDRSRVHAFRDRHQQFVHCFDQHPHLMSL